MSQVLTGLDRIREGEWKRLKGARLGLLANQASLDGQLRTAKEIISWFLPGQLRALFGPQHGHGGAEQDNMVETNHALDRSLNIPIYSLYSETRAPLSHMLELIDALIIDLQDVGTRVYTFPSTLLNCLKAAAQASKKVVVLDRPNPLGGEIVEGNLLRPQLYSFVGPFQLPMRHGLTMGEMAQIFNRVFELGCDLEVVAMNGWRRKMIWHETGLRWIMPSPNMPFPETAYVYPGQVIWEGTNLSEGRGTCRPFEIFGAPYLDTTAVREALDPEATVGCHLQEFIFRPTFHKWQGERCYGFMIHILDPRRYRPYFTALDVLKAILMVHRDSFRWKAPPYEYEYQKRPIDLILGDETIAGELESLSDLIILRRRWSSDLARYSRWRETFLLYD